MSNTPFVDSNIILRLLVYDIPEQGLRARRLFEEATAKSHSLQTTSLVIAEVVWVLEKSLGWNRDLIAERIGTLLKLKCLEIQDRDILSLAFSFYSKKNIDFIDAYHASYLLNQDSDTIYSYDRDFDRIPELKRLEP